MATIAHLIHQWVDLFGAYVKLFVLAIRCRISEQPRRLVVVTLTEHIGDIIACEPVARHVRKEEPHALLVWIVRSEYREIVELYPAIDYVLKIYCLTTWISLRKSRFIDRRVDLHINGRVCPVCRVPLRNNDGEQGIGLNNYFEFGSLLGSFSRAAGLPELDDQPRLQLPRTISDDISALDLVTGYIVVHCRSNEPCKDWSPVRWNDMLDRLQALYSLTVIEIGLESQLRRAESKGYRNLCGRLSILQTAEVIHRAILFVGVDSGPAHLANAVGTPGVVLLGGYRSFKRYNPFTGAYRSGDLAELIYSDGSVNMIEVDSVQKAIERRLAR